MFINFIITDNAHFIKHLLNISHLVLVLVESISFSYFWFLFVHCLDIGIWLIFFLMLTSHPKTFLKLLFVSCNFLIDSLGVFKQTDLIWKRAVSLWHLSRHAFLVLFCLHASLHEKGWKPPVRHRSKIEVDSPCFPVAEETVTPHFIVEYKRNLFQTSCSQFKFFVEFLSNTCVYWEYSFTS